MGKKVKVIRTTPKAPSAVAVAPEEPVTTWVLATGITVAVGDVLQVKHYSTDSWAHAPLRQITERQGVATFHFYLAPPGFVAVHEDRIKTPKPIKVKKVKPAPTKKGKLNVQ